MNATCVKKALIEEIQDISASPELYCHNPTRDFSRSRKLPFETLVSLILNMNGGTLTNELLNYFAFSPDTVSSSAFVQQRSKLKASAFRMLMLGFNKHMEEISPVKTLNGLRLLAVDGTDLHPPTNPEDQDSYFPGANGQRPYNLVHLNALYDLFQHTYVDAVIQKRRDFYECGALVEMVESSSIDKAIVVGDRGYESYNVMAHIYEKGWFYLLRVRENQSIASGLDLPDTGEFDLDISLNITRSITNEIKELLKDRNRYRYVPKKTVLDYLPPLARRYRNEPVFYNLQFRIVRVRITENLVETLVTNLPAEDFPPDKLKQIYNMRWGIETSFRSLKYTVGLIHFHSKKAECIYQEIFAALVIYNFTEWITAHVIIQKGNRKHTYKANFSAAVRICRKFLADEMHPPDVESLIAKYTIPVRPNRKYERPLSRRVVTINFTYRIA